MVASGRCALGGHHHGDELSDELAAAMALAGGWTAGLEVLAAHLGMTREEWSRKTIAWRAEASSAEWEKWP